MILPIVETDRTYLCKALTRGGGCLWADYRRDPDAAMVEECRTGILRKIGGANLRQGFAHPLRCFIPRHLPRRRGGAT